MSEGGRAPTVWDIRRSGLARFDALMALPNVRYMTVGQKIKGSSRQAEKTLKLYVSSKHDMAPNETIPQSIGWVAKSRASATAAPVLTDVVELSGELESFGIRSGHIIRAFDNDLGVCAISYSNAGGRFLITNAHVAVDVARGGVTGPVDVLNRVDGQYHRFGTVLNASQLKATEITTHDVALIAVDPDFQVDDFMLLDMEDDVDRLEGIDTMSPHQYWYSVNGRRFDCMFPERVVGHAFINVDGVRVPYAEFWQLSMVNGSAAAKGHSGALICRMDGGDIVACGLVFGGVAPGRVFAFPFNKMWRLLNP